MPRITLVIHGFIVQYKGKFILWSHLRDLYKKDTSTAMGLRIVPKLKYEHVSLTSFSRMRVDLAAQVHIAAILVNN